LGLIEFAHPRIIGVFWQTVLSLSHFRVRGVISVLLILLIIITIMWWISIAASWQRGWPLTGGMRISLILTLITLFALVRAVSPSPLDRTPGPLGGGLGRGSINDPGLSTGPTFGTSGSRSRDIRIKRHASKARHRSLPHLPLAL
jgi:hypothetical protein